jgi:predicted MFS family arabinose efflux permease
MTTENPATHADAEGRRTAMRFVLLIGMLSIFADFTYEGSRSVLGPFLVALQASGAVVGVVTRFGELMGYTLRLGSGRLADWTGRYWPITILGYVVQMSSVPALSLVHGWPAAAVLIILERVGRAIRNPPRDVMLAHAGKRLGGYGWVFGLHEAMDQFGAMLGPLAVAVVLAAKHDYQLAFAVLSLPAAINLALVVCARLVYPRLQDLEAAPQIVSTTELPRMFWIYLAGAALVAAGFADYPLIAYHFSRAGTVRGDWIAVFYAVAMAVSGAGSLVFGRLFDRFGFAALIGVTLLSALFAPLVFFGGFSLAAVGAAVWGLGMNRSSRRRWRRWWRRRAAPPPSACSRPATASAGFWGALRSASSTISRCRRLSPSASRPKSRRYRFSSGSGGRRDRPGRFSAVIRRIAPDGHAARAIRRFPAATGTARLLPRRHVRASFRRRRRSRRGSRRWFRPGARRTL